MSATRLTLREFLPADRGAICAMHSDRRVRDLLVDDVPLHDLRIADLFITRMQKYYRHHEGLGIWCAEQWSAALTAEDLADPLVREALSDDALHALAQPAPHFVGWFNLMQVTGAPDEIEIGCRLLPSAWGSGLVHDGGDLLLARAFDVLNVPRVWGICHPQHRSVHFVLRSLGFTDDGERPCAGAQARWFVIDRMAWQRASNTPRRVRAHCGRKSSPAGVRTSIVTQLHRSMTSLSWALTVSK